MDKPVVADNKPQKVTLEQGKKYAFCACGLSQTQPLCDGSHKGTDFRPVVFEAEQTEEAFLCQCKQTGNAPYCDGTHKQLGDELIGQPAP